jgi:hypothetical protein
MYRRILQNSTEIYKVPSPRMYIQCYIVCVSIEGKNHTDVQSFLNVP